MTGKIYHKRLITKLLSVFLVLTFILTVPISSLAKGIDSNFVSYEGRDFDRATLSKETVKWLKWYNSLSEEEQQMISYVPSELQNTTLSKSSIPLTTEIDSLMIMSLMPVGGGEPVYNPSYWNDSSRIRKANCYAYSMDVICTVDMKLQPGWLAGQQFTSLTGPAIISAAQADGPYLGNGRSIATTTANAVPAYNQYKVALVIAPGMDYHWYVQNSNGYWSHKPGWGEATNVDASGNSISDPQTCDRDYGYLDYSSWCGYYMVTRTWL